MKFAIKCYNCKSWNHLGDDGSSDIQIYFHKGKPDTMVFYCGNCGNKEKRSIPWSEYGVLSG